MSVEILSLGEPFFGLTAVAHEPTYDVEGRKIAINIGAENMWVDGRAVAPLHSAILQDVAVRDIETALFVDGFEPQDGDAPTMARIREAWPTAFDVRQEDRLRGIEHYMSPKRWFGRNGLTFYHSASVPLNVGLHREHPFCPVPGFREVHTQIMGLGRMQRCRERSLETLYFEEFMAPGATHAPMFDAQGQYPWHQYETITPSVFLAIEMLPEGAPIPE